LSAEAEFRLNLCLPLILFGATAAAEVDWRYALGTLVAVPILAYQGLARRVDAQSVLSRAVIAGIFEHPLQTFADATFGKREPGKQAGGRSARAARTREATVAARGPQESKPSMR
jgi:hypothetical protein